MGTSGYKLTYNALLFDLHNAYYAARRHKRNKQYVIDFEENLEGNLNDICTELWLGRYTPEPSSCFIIHEPKTREIFAAQFRDRIVHHLYYYYTHEMFERTYIYDCYSCIPGRGTSFGISRLEHHIRSVSDNWNKKCYILKMDIRSYFTSINRPLLFNIVMNEIDRMKDKRISNKHSWKWYDVIDIDFIKKLTEIIILTDPTDNSIIIGKESDWNSLPEEKSLFFGDPDDGLPIGNLPSQMYSNVFMGRFDNWIKRDLKQQHYGRYVDDSFDVSMNRNELKDILELSCDFVESRLKLEFNRKKCYITDSNVGIEFIGAFVKPHRTYVTQKTLSKIKERSYDLSKQIISGDADWSYVSASVNSMLGILSHYSCYNIRKELFLEDERMLPLRNTGVFNEAVTKYKMLENG